MRAAAPAAALENRAVQVKDARVARVLGKRVDVLRDVEDRSTAAQASRKIRNRRMRGIGLRILPFPDPFVRSPEKELRVPFRLLGIKGIGRLPVALRIAVGRNAAFGGKPGARENDDDGEFLLPALRIQVDFVHV